MRRGYFQNRIDRHGMRSFVLQVALLTWTAFCALFGCVMLVGAFGAAADNPGEEVGILLTGMFCPASVYVLVALPLGIAAVATMENNPPREN
jgi:uncharacterized membrane protein YdjX (TVP38/TMEM64 family)